MKRAQPWPRARLNLVLDDPPIAPDRESDFYYLALDTALTEAALRRGLCIRRDRKREGHIRIAIYARAVDLITSTPLAADRIRTWPLIVVGQRVAPGWGSIKSATASLCAVCAALPGAYVRRRTRAQARAAVRAIVRVHGVELTRMLAEAAPAGFFADEMRDALREYRDGAEVLTGAVFAALESESHRRREQRVAKRMDGVDEPEDSCWTK